MIVPVFGEFVRTVISSEENITFGSSLFSMPHGSGYCSRRNCEHRYLLCTRFRFNQEEKRPQNFTQQFEEVAEINGEEKMILKWELGNPQSAWNWKE
jgi:hypothetical protein